MTWNFVDVVLIVVVLLNLLYGWRRGYILGVFDLLRWIGSLLIGLRFYHSIARMIGAHADWPRSWDEPIAFFLIVTIASLLLYLLERQILKRLPEEIHQQSANHFLGLPPGLINGLIIAAIAAHILLALPSPDVLRTATRESAIANRLSLLTNRVEAALVPGFGEAQRLTLTLRISPPDPNSTLRLPYSYKVTAPKPRPDLEARMLEMVNHERNAAGLAPLMADPELAEVARCHSIDMFARGYVSHIDREGRNPSNRIRAAGLGFLTAGENISLAPTLPIAHDNLMNSPGHRANILHGTFGRIGIGIVDGGKPGLMITQDFRD